MDTAVLSLMTFPMAPDILQRKMTPKDTLALARQAGIPCVDLMSIPNFCLAQYKNAMQSMNCTPFVRQYGILFKKWGVFVCQRDIGSTTEHKR